jgi:hypothetical protein
LRTDRRALADCSLRDRRFYSFAELNATLGELLKRLNEERPIRRLGIPRGQLLEELDRPTLKPLPIEPYAFAEWRVRRVGTSMSRGTSTAFPTASRATR